MTRLNLFAVVLFSLTVSFVSAVAPVSEQNAEDPVPPDHRAGEHEIDGLQWIDADDERFVLCGLPFADQSEQQYIRIPDRLKGVTRDGVWNHAQHTSGGRLRFQSDATSLALCVTYANLPSMRNMHPFGQAGIDVYLDGGYKRTLAPRKDKDVELVIFKGLDRRMRQIDIYLPLYIGVEIHAIGLDPEAKIEAPKPFALEKPVVYYGTSITQGGCASRSGMSYQAMLSRRMNIDFVNLGFSGNGRGDPEIAELIAEIDAACFVMDMAQNNPSGEDLEKVYGPFLDTLRAAHPDTPILTTTPIFMTTELYGGNTETELPKMRDVIRRAIKERREAGDANYHLIEGYDLIGPDQYDGFVDGVHPNDLGFWWMANGLEPKLRELLELPTE